MTEIFAKTCELGIALGWKAINQNPGCTEHQVDEQWWFAINPHAEPVKCSKGTSVPQVCVYFEFNGWPAGFINAGGGALAAGAIANEDTLIAALEAATKNVAQPATE